MSAVSNHRGRQLRMLARAQGVPNKRGLSAVGTLQLARESPSDIKSSLGSQRLEPRLKEAQDEYMFNSWC